MPLDDVVAQHVLGKIHEMTKTLVEVSRQLDDQAQTIASNFEKQIEPTKERLDAFIQSVPPAIESAEGLLSKYDARAAKLYEDLLMAHADLQAARATIEKAASGSVDDLQNKMQEIDKQVGSVVTAMIAMHKAIDGETGMNSQVRRVADTFDGKMWKLSESIQKLDSIETSKIGSHVLAVNSLKTIIVMAMSFFAGASISQNSPWLGAIGVAALFVGAAFGIFISWTFTKIKN